VAYFNCIPVVADVKRKEILRQTVKRQKTGDSAVILSSKCRGVAPHYERRPYRAFEPVGEVSATQGVALVVLHIVSGSLLTA
jgi:hypothetical protein